MNYDLAATGLWEHVSTVFKHVSKIGRKKLITHQAYINAISSDEYLISNN
tara:strand:+ start:276 stop:425 length:150 start_codon:yes stop_codon:yes gene_type:complete